MKENESHKKINEENKNYFNINNDNKINKDNIPNKELPKFSDILSISSNPEEIFTLLYPIGHGGFGTVYKAIHNETKTIYAIKIIDFIHGLKNKSINNLEIKNNFKNLLFNFNYSSAQQESSLMKLCQKSKYIINYYGSYYSKKANTLWLILEYCPAGSVIDLMLSMNRTYTEKEISTIIKNVLIGLILIHSKNLIHRDIKAANIFLSEDGFAKLGDFGVGTKLGIGDYFRNSKKGSPYWMSPQVVKNLNYDMKTDIWSLGITCCEMCNGEPPFVELNPQNVMEKIGTHPPSVDEFIKKEEHTKEFYDFVKKCLQVEPEKRPSAEELIKHEFIVKFAEDNNFLKELINKHINDINKFRKFNNELIKDGNYKENNKEELKDDKKFKKLNLNYERNNDSYVTSHFNDDIMPNYFKEKENLLIKMISNSSNMDNIGINSTKDSQNQIKEEIPVKSDYKTFQTFHKIDGEDNINDESDSSEIKEIHNIYKSFDLNYFFNENSITNHSNKAINSKRNKIKLVRNKHALKKEKINLLLEKNEYKPEINTDFFSNIKNIIYNKKTRNKLTDKFFSNKINSKTGNIINKSSDNLYIKTNKTNINKKLTNFIYVKSKIKKNEQNNNFIFKKPKITSKYKIGFFNNNFSNRDSIVLDTKCEEGHINKTNLFNTKSNFDILKNTNDDAFSKTNYCFYNNLIRLDEIKIYKSEIDEDDFYKNGLI